MDRLPSMAEAARQMRAGSLRPLDLVEHCLARIRRYDGVVRAWVRVEEAAARDEAQRLAELLEQGVDLGPLHGIPIGIKDIVDVQGLPTEAGSTLLQGCVAQQDAAVVQHLRAAGAIILGKTVTTEFACFDPPPTRNPWNLAHTPGGSSSGSAAAVATEMCAAALGSQTGGSITRPAAYCGVAGLKPTFGTLDLSGVVPISRHLDHLGVLARTPGDLSAMFDAMSPVGPPRAAWSPLIHPPVLHPIAHFFLEEADEDVRQVTQAAYDALRSAGAELQTLQLPPSFAQIPPLHRLIMAAEAAENHLDTFARNAPAYGPQVGGLILEGLATSAADYLRALRHQDVLRGEVERLFGNEIIAMSPATVTAAPATLDTTGDPRFNSPWSYVGLPTVTIPCGLTPDHMPCGLQLIGPPHRERELLSAAAWCAGILGGTPPPPLLSRP